MYLTREEQVAPEQIETRRNSAVATQEAEQANEYAASVLARTFSGSAPEPNGNGAAKLLRSLSFSSSSNSRVRGVALSRAQTTRGNRYTQRLVSQVQLSAKNSRTIQRECACGGTCTKCTEPSPLNIQLEESRPIQRQTKASEYSANAIQRDSYFSAGEYTIQSSSLPSVLPKAADSLVVGAADSAMEHDADRIAEAATGSPREMAARPSSSAPTATSSSSVQPAEPGSPLSSHVRERIEPVLGADLAHVRVHDNPLANEAAESINAKAFTHQNHIWLGPQQSADDVRLMAHEATHVVQQERESSSAAQPNIQRQLGWAHTQHPNQPAYPRPPDPYPKDLQCDQRALAAMHTEVVELKGTPEFNPSPWLAEGLRCARPNAVWVKVKFGTMASGAIRIRMNESPSAYIAPGARPPLGTYETVDDQPFIDLTHPAFPGGGRLAPPRMYLKVHNSVVTGFISFVPHGARLSLDEVSQMMKALTLENVLGWRGLVDIQPAAVVNEVRDGVLRYALQDFTFGMQDLQGLAGVTGPQADYTGKGNFSVTDEKTDFSAETEIKAEGMSAAKMPLRRAQGRIFGSASFGLTLAPRDAFGGTFSGSLQGTYSNGVMNISGTARYRSAKLNGTVTVLIAPRGVAWTEVYKRLPKGAPAVTVGQAMAPGHVVVGWGSLDFHINKWLTGHVSVVVDPEGYITSHGILRPTVEYQFLDEPGKYEINKDIAHFSKTATLWTKVVASLSGTITADLKAGGKIGPGRLYGLEIEGQFSTRPGTVFEGKITGRANLSAQAALALKLEGTLSGNLGTPPAAVEVVSVTLGIIGQATLRAYVELQPTFERLQGAAPDEADYKISGKLTAAGAVDFGLKGYVKFSLLRAGPKINLGKVEYRLGSIGVEAEFNHLLGSKNPIEFDVKAADFNDAQYTGFIQDLFDEDAPENEGDHTADLTQPGGKPAAIPKEPTTLTTTFMMKGKQHTLSVDYLPRAVLKMASNGDELDKKLENEIATIEQQRQAQQGEEADLLNAEAQTARGLLGRSRAVERTLGELQSEERKNPDAAGFDEIANGLTAYAEQFDKDDLAQTPPTPVGTGVAEAKTDAQGRYIITNRAELAAVRAAKPTRPADLPPQLETIWNRYAGEGGQSSYFDEALRIIEKDLNRPNYRVRHEPPLNWPTYVEARDFYGSLSARKAFQAELREAIIQERGDVDPSEAEIDVGVQKGNRRVRYADLVIEDPINGLEVYSVKVHNIYAQTQKFPDDDASVRGWITATLREDIDEAVNYYGGSQTFRREFRSLPTGRAGGRAEGRHPRYGQQVFVNKVILVWRGSSDLVPDRFRQFIRDTGRDIGITERSRSRITVEVRLIP